jgi:iron(III) transport system ATP-binding protein
LNPNPHIPDALSVSGLTKRFDPREPAVVSDVSFSVAPGEIFALLGPSGCGKTTTLRLVGGFERPDAGTIVAGGQALDDARRHVAPERRGIGLVFQDYALFPHLTVVDNVVFGLRGLPRERRRARAREVLGLLGLGGLEMRHPHELSGGQQQRVAIARTIAPSPRLILLDEPFSNLDALLRQVTRQEIRHLFKREGVSVVLVTHDQEEALSFADRIAVMRSGRIEQTGTAEEVYNRPRTLFVAQFLGRTNLLMSHAEGREAATPLGRVKTDRPASGSVLLSLRPEHLTLIPASEIGLEICGIVASREFRGHDITFRVEIGGAEYLVHTDNRMTFGVGDRVGVRALEPAVVLEAREPPAPA